MGRLMVGERGQTLPLMVVLMMLGLALVLVASRLAPVLDDAARARTAADAAALAGAVEGRAAADSMAVANGGILVDYEQVGDTVTVTVRVGLVAARARAATTTRWISNRTMGPRPSGRGSGRSRRTLGECRCRSPRWYRFACSMTERSAGGC